MLIFQRVIIRPRTSAGTEGARIEDLSFIINPISADSIQTDSVCLHRLTGYSTKTDSCDIRYVGQKETYPPIPPKSQ